MGGKNDMKYGYARVLIKKQELKVQIDELKKGGKP